MPATAVTSHVEPTARPRTAVAPAAVTWSAFDHVVDTGAYVANQPVTVPESVGRSAMHRPLDRLAAEPDLSAARIVDEVRTAAEAADLLEAVTRGWERADHSLRARALILAELVCRRAAQLGSDAGAVTRIEAAARTLAGDGGAAALGQAASAEVAAALARKVHLPSDSPRAAIGHDQVVWATAPARLDFAGGWSDTPPICSDRGGTVVNAAVTLKGQYPIQAIAKLRDEPVVTITSIDLGQRVVLDRVEQLFDSADPGQWDALPRACLSLAGFAAGRSSGDLANVLRAFGGGIDLTVFSALPKGSGLGTSSILGAAVLTCLARLTGRSVTCEQLVEQTSLLEQVLTTGGGWQDQVGAIYPGVKLTQTQPGPDQAPAVTRLTFDPAVVKDQMLLYYTGLTRLAKNILEGVVHRYLARDPDQLGVINELKADALEIRRAIDAHDVEGFGHGVRQYWELKKRIDPGATTLAIDGLVERVEADCLGYTLLGAGGGGFLLMVARDEPAARRIRRNLSTRPAAPGARFFDFAIDDHGLNVCVL